MIVISFALWNQTLALCIFIELNKGKRKGENGVRVVNERINEREREREQACACACACA